MDLWIRSQDREKLVKCNDIAIKRFLLNEIPKDECCYSIVGYFDKETEYETLGSYKTEKRTIEILDEIQGYIKLKYLYELKEYDAIKTMLNGVDEIKASNNMIVYEMPED